MIASLSLFLILAVAGPRQAFAQPNNPPVITGANGFPNSGGIINGLETCQNTPLYICVTATDPDGDGLTLNSVTVTTGSGATIVDAVPGDLCFTYVPTTWFSGADQLEVIVCDDAPSSLCDTVLINITVTPAVIADAGPDQGVCLLDGTRMAAVDPSPATGMWTQIAGLPTNIVNPTQHDTWVLSLQHGTQTYRWVVSNGSCLDSSEVDILYNVPIILTAGPDDEICESDGTYTLSAASVQWAVSVMWETDGTGTFDDPTLVNPVYTPSQNDSDGACPDASDDMVLNITGQAVVYAGADASICETAVSYVLADATAEEYATVEWSSSGDGSFDDIGIVNPVYTIGANDIANGSVFLILTGYGNGSCLDVVDTMLLSISLQPIANAGPDGDM